MRDQLTMCATRVHSNVLIEIRCKGQLKVVGDAMHGIENNFFARYFSCRSGNEKPITNDRHSLY